MQSLLWIIIKNNKIMPPKKKKASGSAAAGEKTFKNLCSACHSLSVSPNINTASFDSGRSSQQENLAQ